MEIPQAGVCRGVFGTWGSGDWLLKVLGKYIAGNILCPLLLGGWFCRDARSGKLICRVNSKFSSGNISTRQSSGPSDVLASQPRAKYFSVFWPWSKKTFRVKFTMPERGPMFDPKPWDGSGNAGTGIDGSSSRDGAPLPFPRRHLFPCENTNGRAPYFLII